jgi:uncharacterized membrane protein (UPF0127 family)
MFGKKKLVYLLIIAVVIAIVALSFFGQTLNKQIKNISSIPTFNKFTLKKNQPKIKINDIEIFVDIASSPEEKARGLSGRKSLGKNEGMLFIFNNKSIPSFWMKDMNFAIDIIWIADNKIVGIEKSVPPPKKGESNSQLSLYKPEVGIDYVLEVNANFCERNNIKVDDTTDLSNIFND